MKRRLFHKLNDVQWLSLKYESEKMSCSEIGHLISCSKDSVRKALIAAKIPLRTATETNRHVKIRSGFKSRMYPLLNDKKWLFENYITNKFSTVKIAKLAGAKKSNSVTQALVRLEIPIRDYDEMDELRRKNDFFVFDQDIIIGGLLGDGSMSIYNKQSKHDRSFPYFNQKSKWLNHALYIADKIFTRKSFERIELETIKKNDKIFLSYTVSTLAKKELLPIYREWYPSSNNFIKLVPKTLLLTPGIMLHWFLGDGSTTYRNREKEKTAHKIHRENYREAIQVTMVICSESFSREDNENLAGQMSQKFGIYAKISPTQEGRGSGWRIRVPNSSIERFFNVIGPCPKELQDTLGYRWKIPSPGEYY